MLEFAAPAVAQLRHSSDNNERAGRRRANPPHARRLPRWIQYFLRFILGPSAGLHLACQLSPRIAAREGDRNGVPTMACGRGRELFAFFVRCGLSGGRVAGPHRADRRALRRWRRDRYDGARHGGPAGQDFQPDIHRREQARRGRRHRRRLCRPRAAGWLHAAVCRQHALYRPAAGAECGLCASEGPRPGEHYRDERHGSRRRQGRAIRIAGAIHRRCARASRQADLFERRHRHQQSSFDGLSRRQGRPRHGARAVHRRPGGAHRGAVEIGRHAFRQFVGSYRAGEKRQRQSARRIDARAHAAASGRADGRRDHPGLRIHRLERLRRDRRRAGGNQNETRASSANRRRRSGRDQDLRQSRHPIGGQRHRNRPSRASARICRFTRKSSIWRASGANRRQARGLARSAPAPRLNAPA